MCTGTGNGAVVFLFSWSFSLSWEEKNKTHIYQSPQKPIQHPQLCSQDASHQNYWIWFEWNFHLIHKHTTQLSHLIRWKVKNGRSFFSTLSNRPNWAQARRLVIVTAAAVVVAVAIDAATIAAFVCGVCGFYLNSEIIACFINNELAKRI